MVVEVYWLYIHVGRLSNLPAMGYGPALVLHVHRVKWVNVPLKSIRADRCLKYGCLEYIRGLSPLFLFQPPPPAGLRAYRAQKVKIN